MGFLVRRDYELRPTYPSVATPTWCTYDTRLLKRDLGKCLARFFRRRFVFSPFLQMVLQYKGLPFKLTPVGPDAKVRHKLCRAVG